MAYRLILFLFLLPIIVFGQRIDVQKITVRENIVLRGRSIDSFSVDGTFTSPSNLEVPTQKAIYDYISGITAGLAYLPIAGGSLTGTGGAGFLGFPTQSSSPSTPASGYREFADASGRFAWKPQSDGFVRAFNGTLTADRVFTFQNKSYTFADHADVTALQSTVAGLGSTYFPLTGGAITGTGGAGYFGAISQSSAPSTPGSGFRLFADASGRLAWKGTNGFVRVFDGTANTADRSYVLPDASGTFDLIGVAQSITGRKTFTGDNLLAFAPLASAGTHIIGWVETATTPTTGDRYGVYAATPGYNAKGGISFRVADGATGTYDIVFQTTNNTLAGTPGTISGAIQDVLWVSNQGNVIVNGSTNTYSTRLAVNGEMSNSSFRTQSSTILRMNPDNATSRIVGGGFGGSSVFSIHGGTGDFNGFTDVGQSPKITFSSASGLNLQAGNQDAGKSLTISFASASATGYSVTTPYTFLNSSVTFTPQGSGAAGFVYNSTTRPAHPINSLTTAQRDALTGMVAGDVVFNLTTGRFNYYTGSAWVEMPSVAAGGFGTNQVAVGTATGNLGSSAGLVFDGAKLTIAVTGGILINGSYTGTASVGVAIGGTINATNSTESPIAIGSGSSVTASRGIAIGLSATAANGVAIGRESVANTNEFVLGSRVGNSNGLQITNLKFGADANGNTPGAFRAITQGGAFGTDQPGGGWGIFVGAGTGAAQPGNFSVFTPNLLASGSTLQSTYTPKFSLNGHTQQFQLGPTTTAGSSALDVSNVNNIGSRPFPATTTTQRNAIAGRVISATFVSAGSGYTSAPTVSITGGGGSGATAVASVNSGGVFTVTIINQGSGYTSTPTISFSGGGGASANFTAVTTNEVDGLGIYNTTTKTYQYWEATTPGWRDFGSYQSGKLSIGALNADPSVLVDMVSTVGGLRIPTMSDANIAAISSPVLMLMAASTTDERIHVKRTSGFFHVAYTEDVKRDSTYKTVNANLDLSALTTTFKNRFHTVRIKTVVTVAASGNNTITMPVPSVDLLGISFKVSTEDTSGDGDISVLSFGSDGSDGYLYNGDGTFATTQNLFPGLGVYLSVAWCEAKSAYRWELQ